MDMKEKIESEKDKDESDLLITKNLIETDTTIDYFSYSNIMEFGICFFSLQISYLIWGIMQELIMDTKFTPTPLNPAGKFPSATFCVFSNRCLAILVAALMCRIKHGTVQSSAPLLYFTPCALSNTISSWSQYQALLFVSFSLQTLFKATKVIPVMVMGKIVLNKKNKIIEYSEAVMITLGVLIFSIYSKNDSKKMKANNNSNISNSINTISNVGGNDIIADSSESNIEIIGFLLLCAYVLSDSFTSQWQSKIYKDYGKIDHYHMMYGVNMSSVIITTIALLISGDVYKIYEFMLSNPAALWYNVLTAITSTTGQIAIFYTIKRYGPICFTVIMTTRQMLSILLSTVLFRHSITLKGILGIILVFLSIFHSIYRQMNDKKNAIFMSEKEHATLSIQPEKEINGNDKN